VTELLLGCGFARKKLLALPGEPHEWRDLVTLDINPKCDPDIICDLNERAWRGASIRAARFFEDDWYFKDDSFDEVHAYEVLEHLGQQGDAEAFFSTFINIHRILRSNGVLFATVPSRYSAWLWGDPSHRRVICAESLAFLSQEVIAKNRAQGTAMSDFSSLWNRDFKVLSAQDNHTNFIFCLQAIK
jgi:SAM-dependent methyltransferase